MTLLSVSFYPSVSEDVTQLANEYGGYRSIFDLSFDVLENAPFRKSVIDTQSSQRMICPENTPESRDRYRYFYKQI